MKFYVVVKRETSSVSALTKIFIEIMAVFVLLTTLTLPSKIYRSLKTLKQIKMKEIKVGIRRSLTMLEQKPTQSSRGENFSKLIQLSVTESHLLISFWDLINLALQPMNPITLPDQVLTKLLKNLSVIQLLRVQNKIMNI